VQILTSDLNAEMPVAPAARYLNLPAITSRNSIGAQVVVRFTPDATAVIYENPYGPNPMVLAAPHDPGEMLIVSNDALPRVRDLRLEHDIISIQLVGPDLVALGYQHGTGLHASLVDLGAARILDAIPISSHYDTSFYCCTSNAVRMDDGSAFLGLTTSSDAAIAEGWHQEEDDSNVSVLSVSSGRLHFDGDLTLDRSRSDNLSNCHIRRDYCISWYGNAQPIFVAGRLFALIGHDLIEGEIVDHRLREVHRLHLSTVPHVWAHK